MSAYIVQVEKEVNLSLPSQRPVSCAERAQKEDAIWNRIEKVESGIQEILRAHGGEMGRHKKLLGEFNVVTSPQAADEIKALPHVKTVFLNGPRP